MKKFSVMDRLALGTVQFGLDYGISNNAGKTPEAEVDGILDEAWSQGINMLDTASAYGSSESVIGNLSSGRFHIITKFPPTIDSVDALYETFRNSLRNLRAHSVYAYLAHDVNSLLKNSDIWDGMKLLKDAGKTEKIGYSLYKPEQLYQLLDMKVIPDIVQIPFNFFDQRFKLLLPELKRLGTEIHVRSVFLQGLFFINPSDLSDFFEVSKKPIQELQTVFQSREELAAWLMQFVLGHLEVDRLVFGVNTLAHLNSNLSLVSKEVDINFTKFFDLPEQILMPNLWPKN